jgi:malyl-CoA/(S)-citramalyl-CoA lyase
LSPNTNEHGIVEHEIRTFVGEAPRLDSILVPKVESVDAIAQVERLSTARPASFATLEIEALLETACGIVNVDEIAGSSRSLTALHFGVGDFSAYIGARNVDIGGTHPGYAVTLMDRADN